MARFCTGLMIASMLVCGATSAMAQSQGDWTVSIGVATVEPKSDNGELANLDLDVDSDESFIFTAEYFVRDNLGIELLLATPFEHDFDLGTNLTGSTKHLPPTLSLNYHFQTGTPWKPYVGAGINYTRFSSEKLSNGSKLELESSWGASVQAGLDYQITSNDAIRFNVRWFDIDSDAKLDGSSIGTAEIDPYLVGLAYVHRF